MTFDRRSASHHPVMFALALAGALLSGCDKGGGSETPTTASPASSTRALAFSGTITVGGARFYSFSMATEGTITARLDALEGPNVDPAVAVHMGIGTPAGTSCSAGRTLVRVGGGDDGVAAFVAGNQSAGTYCVLIADAGNLVAPAAFRVTVELP